MANKKKDRYTFTQEQWDREVGLGKVPKNYRKKKDHKDGTPTNR